MLPYTEVVMIGSGRVAKSLGSALCQANIPVSQVYSQNRRHAESLANDWFCDATDCLAEIRPSADLYIIAVSDDSIKHVAVQMPRVQGVVIHTSGASPIQLLDGVSRNTGVFYPLQSFSAAGITALENVPLIVEASNQSTTDKLVELALLISGKSLVLPYQERSWLHLAAVVSANFSNFMVSWGEALLKEKKIDFSLLQPLLETVSSRFLKGDAFDAQTGPAIRGDTETLARHLKMLEGYPEYQALYDQISKNIINLNKKYGRF
ncbi:MAG: DUF2520 domain-containing protein [Bacteroidetes bacterium]|nr:DUF2520 domain-containing protein [Bacteroidota bacterium]